MGNSDIGAFPETPSKDVDLDEIKTKCECLPQHPEYYDVEPDGTVYYSDGQITFDDGAFGLGTRCMKCGHKVEGKKK